MALASSAKVSRFNLLQLETGEKFLTDVAVVHTPPSPAEHHPLPHVKGRLRICSASVVFEPAEQDLPLLRIPFSKVTCIDTVNETGWNSAASRGAGGHGARFRVQCSSLIALFANNKPGPYQQYVGCQEHVFAALHSGLERFMPLLLELLSCAKLAGDKAEEAVQELVLEHERRNYRFDAACLVDPLHERIEFEAKVQVQVPLVAVSGRLVVTGERLYVQPFSSLAPTNLVSIELQSISRVRRRRHCHMNVALELRLRAEWTRLEVFSPISLGPDKHHGSKHSLFVIAPSSEQRDQLANILLALCPKIEGARGASSEGGLDAVEAVAEAEALQRRWVAGDMSNYDYLLALNEVAGRSFNDISQYPVMPWVISDYHSLLLDIDDPASFRDLSTPIGALQPTRLAALKERFQQMATLHPHPPPDQLPGCGAGEEEEEELMEKQAEEGSTGPFLYGTHYSTPGYVAHFMVRKAPDLLLHLQSGKFDAADRCFASVAASWRAVNDNMADVKELIPEFFGTDTSFLTNDRQLNLGLKQNGMPVGDVELPLWANDAADFLAQNRRALESPHVCQHLHEWIDLIFGFKSRGPAAVAADNIFFPLTYSHVIQRQVDKCGDPLARKALLLQAQEFGQCCDRLFSRPHPPRVSLTLHKTLDPNREPRQGPMQASLAQPHQQQTRADADRRSIPPPPSEPLSTAPCTNADSTAILPCGDGDEDEEDDILSETLPQASTRERSSGHQHQQVHQEKTAAASTRHEDARCRSGFKGHLRGGGAHVKDRWWCQSEIMASLCSRPPAKFKAKDGITALSYLQYRVDRREEEDDGQSLSSLPAAEAMVVLASSDATLRVIDVGSRRQVRCWDNLGDLALSSVVSLPEGLGTDSGDRLVVVGSWDTSIRVVSVEYGRTVQHLSVGHDDAISSLALSGPHHQRLLLSGSWDGWIKAWAMSGQGFSSTPLCSVAELESEVKQVDILDDGSICASLCAEGLVKLWDVRSGTAVQSHWPSRASTIQLLNSHSSSPFPTLALASLDEPSAQICLWDLRHTAKPCVQPSEVPMCALTSLSSDGSSWVAGTADGDVWIGNFGEDEGEPTTPVKISPSPHTDVVSCVGLVCVQDDAKRARMMMTSGSHDGSACLWDAYLATKQQ
jgi:WD40 repeat protein